MARSPLVHIHYHRPPDRLQVHAQPLVHDGADVKVTVKEATRLERPIEIDGRTVLETGAAVVWFTFPGLWHDVGRFHTADGAFTGLYANVLTPVEFRPDHVWHTTDLFLDLWVDDGGARVLDEDELEEARARGWVDAPTGARARREVERIRWEAEAGLWPPAVVREWTLERALDAVEG